MVMQGKRKSWQRGSQFRSRQRAKAMAVALGIVIVITLGLLSLVSSPSNLSVEGEVGHVTRHLRELLLDPNVHGHGVLMEAQRRRTINGEPRGMMMEAQALRVVGQNPAVTMAADTKTTSTRAHPAH
ncbi:hypothetical protein F441_10338 [Phytophthora nicotianae CJ01A1]|uniref:Uncharacterized protein n=4 Tax=Phytophthora nicotianae TaxID=4792 RepID=W2RAZ3_PHYN3|nr:hypothetical protein PPTG_01835 [Phytophthora nicotianae INRA-310]ETL91464.1 hypothetical protein L917_09998 [Phytophthora nicotianae]ETN21715.1 hypothetical protein PPTG_01835 [Phytophthora nicotianae INRA-310]ETO73590.1 hypothetical protein F444_10498 [Phytophthora nicotianae P1976]ETP14774.1 hypothetical protein F441_10338 [Phytophthora nicotianae CJ01A1]